MVKAAFLGPETTFTHQAAIKYFGEKAFLEPKISVAEVFDSVEKKEADFGVVPVENSSEGIVAHTLDSFVDSKLRIVAEEVIQIRHCLLSNFDKKEIKKIYSHPQALGQCKKYLQKNFPKAELIESTSTSNAARISAKESFSGAIASELAGKFFGLKIVDRDINDEKNNQTRFFIIGDKGSAPTKKDKTTILFSTKNVPGALFNVLKILAENKINMTKIESRPSKKKAWTVIFFVEFEGYEKDNVVLKALNEIELSCEFLKVLGSYPEKVMISD